MAGAWAFNCPKRGHELVKGGPEQITEIAGKHYLGGLCRKCGCVVYLEMADGFEPSKIITV